MRLPDRLHRLLVPDATDQRLVASAPPKQIREIVRRFWPEARPLRKVMVLSALPILAVAALEAAEIWLFGLLVDEVLVPRDLGALVPIAAVFLALLVAGAVAEFLDGYAATWLSEKFLLAVRTRLFAHLHALAPGQLDRRRAGDVLQRLTSDVAAIERFVLSGLADGLSAIARLVFFAGAMLLLSWKLALAAFVVVPLFALVVRAFARLVKHSSREARRRTGSLGAVAEESLATAQLVQSLNRQDAEVARFHEKGERIVEAKLATERVKGLFAPFTDLLQLAGILLVVAGGVWALDSGDLTLGQLLVFLTYLSQMLGPVRDLSSLATSLFAAAAGAERVLELLDEEPRVTPRPGARRLVAPRGHLELEGVGFRYPQTDRDVLDGVDLRVLPGETVALVGDSGSGKTTLLRLLLRFDDPVRGTVRLDGHDLRDLDPASVRDAIGLLTQETLLVDASVRENVLLARPEASEAELADAAAAAGLDRVVAALPDGWDTRIGQRGRALSGGQRQRLAVARTLLRDPAVLVLDEPTTGLDADARDALLEPLMRLAGKRTTIVVSHDPAVVERADRVVELRDGRLVVAEPSAVPA